MPVTMGASGAGSWEPGTPVGRFILLTTLAQGGMAEIWLARQSGLKGFEKLVVIKRMMTSLEADPESLEMFLTEARLAAQLSHPNVVQIYELGEQLGSPYIVMEYVDGEDLGAVRRTSQKHGLLLFDHYSARLISMAAEGLHYAHTKVGIDGKPLHIVHRDVSPQNLLVTFEGGLKVVDFGIAKIATQHTHSGKLKGKLAYMSPEQSRGEALDARSDVFSLGIVLFEMVTRTRLISKMGDIETLRLMGGTDPFPRPSERRSDLPDGLEPIILKAMERKPEQRFQSAREFQEALEEWLRSHSKTVSAPELADYLRTLFARRIHDRRTLIETAMTADLTPGAQKHLARLTLHASSPSLTSSPRAIPRRQMMWLSAGVVTLLVTAVILLRVLLSEPGTGQPGPAAEPAVVVGPLADPAPSTLVVSTVPPGAMLTVDGKARGRTPRTVEGLEPGEHQLAAALEGYQAASRKFSLAAAGERVVIEVALSPVDKEPTVAEPRRQEAPGKLSIKTMPWSTVYLGKKKLGDTPLVELPLPAGKHTLRLEASDGTVNSIEVEIHSHETTVKKLKL
jgi:eukaryotic-like serine/threonine-protein kinase